MVENTLEYYFDDGRHIMFNDYLIDTTGNVSSLKYGKLNIAKNGKYSRVTVKVGGKSYTIQVGRAIASTFLGRPPTLKHTADHNDRNPANDTFDNICWLDKTGQSKNREMPGKLQTALVVVKDGVERSVKEWAEHLKDEINLYGKKYTCGMIKQYATRKQHGFMYKEYPDLPGEIWKLIEKSKNSKGAYWEISNMNRVKFVTTNAKNVIEGKDIGTNGMYPVIRINKKSFLCHHLVFEAFFPDEYALMKTDEIILHKNDDKRDFRPQMLRIGTAPENSLDAYNNGKRDGGMTSRTKCVSYLNGILEKEYDSQSDAERYLKSIGYDKADQGSINTALRKSLSGDVKFRYDRTWEYI